MRKCTSGYDQGIRADAGDIHTVSTVAAGRDVGQGNIAAVGCNVQTVATVVGEGAIDDGDSAIANQDDSICAIARRCDTYRRVLSRAKENVSIFADNLQTIAG